MLPEPRTDVQGSASSWSYVLPFLILWAGAQLFVALISTPEVFRGAQIDTDGYLRLVRVGLLLESGAWFDGSIPRSNWPLGEDHHWTRPLDVLIILLALPFFPLGTEVALSVAGFLVSPLIHLAACLALVWAIRPLVPGSERFLAMPALLVQPGVLGYGTPGRADHHILIFMLVILALGSWIRALLEPERRRPALAVGAFSGLGLWVSPETLLPLGVLLLSAGAAWVLHGPRFAQTGTRLCLGLLATVALAILLEHSPSEWTRVHFDQVSIAHVTMSALALGFWLAARRTAPSGLAANVTTTAARPPWRLDRGQGLRLALGIVGAIVALGVMAIVHPRFFRGPWVDVDPAVIAIWLRHVQELQPVMQRGARDTGALILNIGPALMLLPFSALLAWREWSETRGPIWLMLFVSLAIYVPLSVNQIRFTGLLGVVIAILMVELLRRLLPRASQLEPSWVRRPARVGLLSGLLVGFLAAGQAVDASVTAITGRPTEAAPLSEGQCDLEAIAPFLGDPHGRWREPKTIAAFIDYGPELLYRTPHRVLAGPYHRNRDGILDTYRLLAREADEASSIVAERDVDLILLCPAEDRFFFDRGSDDSLYRRLLTGELPPWIVARPLPAGWGGGFLLFEVLRP